MRPGGVEYPGNGLDDDCAGGDAVQRLQATVSPGWRVSRKGTRVTRLVVRDAPPTATVTRITAPNMIGKVVRFEMRRARLPRSRTLCLPVGAASAVRC